MVALGLGCAVAAAPPPPPPPTLVTVYGLWGLSNAAGLTQVPSPNLWPDARGHLFTFNLSNASLQMSASQSTTPATITAGPDLNLGTLLLDSGRGPIATAKSTRGGSLMSNWDPAGAQHFITEYGTIFQAAVTAMEALYPGAIFALVHWCIMGEQDALSHPTPNQPLYIAQQTACMDYLDALFPTYQTTHLSSLINAQLATMPAPFLGTNAIRAAQVAVPGVVIVDNDAITPYRIAFSDPHYSSDQDQQIGANAFALL